jgi:hypothetical protein
MSKRRKQRKSLYHGVIEKELRSLHQKGAHVERQRDLIRTLLNTLVCQQGGKIVLSKDDFENARGGRTDIEQTGTDAYTVTFVPADSLPPKRTLWQRLRGLFRRSPKLLAETPHG